MRPIDDPPTDSSGTLDTVLVAGCLREVTTSRLLPLSEVSHRRLA